MIEVKKEDRYRPYKARRSEQVENPMPAECDHDAHCKEGHDSDGKSAETMRDAMYDAAFRFGEPELHCSGGGGEGSRFRQSENKTYTDDRCHASGHGGPPRH